ncbi:uncharacterized protein PHACADRAFT_101599 [Phanerochaete carnosa HHB-10118-sp]|uniref:MATH domain-containing protein n=1 Tax=Phanerochaete carnosa (strain HHB-10118-sp) TaxID=650164 RepID=K5VJU1_PHACS|nr:uncharacterized protein PHACADRAFT_101599 [Phanerochaete carnosa HHB-10118-sp]EKM51633.1 hypothetical protein PHACADRAFT_101599 [Phanerochaete carnosa HHB-10118-sp]
MESTTVRFEWTVRDLAELFDNSKGEIKSKVTKSAKFGGGRWQILFYPNAGIVNADGQGFVSLYLACEPTAEEKDNAVNGKRWVREGVYKFGFELRNPSRTILFNNKEANDHSFSWKTVNWGWAQFARRDTVFYQASSVRQADAMLITCTITSSPVPPVPPPAIPRQPVPKDLLDAMGSLLDDPAYSDVEFVLPRRRRKGVRIIYAAGRLLRRVDYFDTMFHSGFAEGMRLEPLPADLDEDLGGSLPHRFQDSDDEDDNDDLVMADDTEIQLPRSETEKVDVQGDSGGWVNMEDDRFGVRSDSHEVAEQRDTARVRVVVRDVAYSTYRAALYYIYTDTIVFAPLASSFTNHGYFSPMPPALKQPRSIGLSTPAATAPETQGIFQLGHTQKSSLSLDIAPGHPSSRKEWIAEWEKNNPGRPRPCSAKAVYRLADSGLLACVVSRHVLTDTFVELDLQELKDRAFQHIIKSLAVDNVAYEVFSDFSAAFEDVRKVEVQFFLDHWADIRSSDAMRNVWQQIRVGRHPGFEEVWPLIAGNLEFKPLSKADTTKEGEGM